MKNSRFLYALGNVLGISRRRKCLASLALAAAAAMLPGAAGAATYPSLEPGTFRPMFGIGPKHDIPSKPATLGTLPQWNGSFTDLKGNTVHFTQIGGDPSNTDTTSTVTVLIIPIRMIYGSQNGNMTFDPNKTAVFGKRNVVKNLLKSPLFGTPGELIDYNQGGTDLGNTQYIDAFQRGTWWGNDVSVNTNYHVLFKTRVEPEQSITVSADQGKVISNPYGSGVVGTDDINAFDAQLETFMKNISDVNPGVLPLFVTYDIVLTSLGQCCYGGYHNDNGHESSTIQTYAWGTYEDDPGSFFQDVSVFSHELGEWMDDPFIDNFVHCNDNTLMEVGDPLEYRANYGTFPYKLHGFTYNLQSLVFMPYFGAPRTDSANKWYSFQNDEAGVCPGQ